MTVDQKVRLTKLIKLKENIRQGSLGGDYGTQLHLRILEEKVDKDIHAILGR